MCSTHTDIQTTCMATTNMVHNILLVDDDFTKMYSPQFSNSFHEGQSLVEEVEEIQVPTPKKKYNRRRHTAPTKKPQNEKGEEQRCYSWTLEEETALCKGWVHISKDIFVGNARKERGFWVQVVKHMQATCPISKRRDNEDEVEEVHQSRPTSKDQENRKAKVGSSAGTTNAFDVELLAKMMATEYVMASDPYNLQNSQEMSELLRIKTVKETKRYMSRRSMKT
ncbi:hypothetical protein Tco_0257254 [Tanacetum coccineum]